LAEAGGQPLRRLATTPRRAGLLSHLNQRAVLGLETISFPLLAIMSAILSLPDSITDAHRALEKSDRDV
jgi:hypothetical protein